MTTRQALGWVLSSGSMIAMVFATHGGGALSSRK